MVHHFPVYGAVFNTRLVHDLQSRNHTAAQWYVPVQYLLMARDIIKMRES